MLIEARIVEYKETNVAKRISVESIRSRSDRDEGSLIIKLDFKLKIIS